MKKIILIFSAIIIGSCGDNNSKSDSAISNFFDNTKSLEELTIKDKKFTLVTTKEEKVVCYLKIESKHLNNELLRKLILGANNEVSKKIYVPSSFVPIDYYIEEFKDNDNFDFYRITVSFSETGKSGEKMFDKAYCTYYQEYSEVYFGHFEN